MLYVQMSMRQPSVRSRRIVVNYDRSLLGPSWARAYHIHWTKCTRCIPSGIAAPMRSPKKHIWVEDSKMANSNIYEVVLDEGELSPHIASLGVSIYSMLPAKTISASVCLWHLMICIKGFNLSSPTASPTPEFPIFCPPSTCPSYQAPLYTARCGSCSPT